MLMWLALETNLGPQSCLPAFASLTLEVGADLEALAQA